MSPAARGRVDRRLQRAAVVGAGVGGTGHGVDLGALAGERLGVELRHGAVVDADALAVAVGRLQRGDVDERAVGGERRLHLDVAPLVVEHAALHDRGRRPPPAQRPPRWSGRPSRARRSACRRRRRGASRRRGVERDDGRCWCDRRDGSACGGRCGDRRCGDDGRRLDLGAGLAVRHREEAPSAPVDARLRPSEAAPGALRRVAALRCGRPVPRPAWWAGDARRARRGGPRRRRAGARAGRARRALRGRRVAACGEGGEPLLRAASRRCVDRTGRRGDRFHALQ